MGALTAVSTGTWAESVGSCKLLIVDFALVTSGAAGDTWASGLNNAVGYWANCTTSGASCSVSYAYSGTTGTFTICPAGVSGGTASAVRLYILTKG